MPDHNSLLDDIAATFHRDGELWRCEEHLLRFVKSRHLQAPINRELSALSANTAGYSSSQWLDGNFVLHTDEEWTLIYTLFKHQPKHLYSFPYHALIAPLGPGAIGYDIYALPPDHQNEVFRRGIELTRAHSAVVRFGSLIRVDARKVLIDVRVDAPVVALCLCTRPIQALQWAFDRTTLRSIQAIAADDVSTRLLQVAQVSGVVGDRRLLPELERLAREHPHHFVRWEAIKSVCKIDGEIGRELVERAAADPHPHVAMAAQRSLEANRHR